MIIKFVGLTSLLLSSYNSMQTSCLINSHIDTLAQVSTSNIFITECSTSAVALVQDEDEKFKVNWRRVAITSMFGFGFVGPVGHYWYVYLPGSFWILAMFCNLFWEF